ncbi:hypothetical protein C8R45DRAFT_1107890 [Mycena sanguinolenta]|nr:hypothetical protein C8R45DRAFT_1107890 [Mycena sanguinolenta]
MDSFTATIPTKQEDIVLPPVNEDGGGGSSGSCVADPAAAASSLEQLSRSTLIGFILNGVHVTHPRFPASNLRARA